jgi:hypothetical protein
VFLVKTFPVEQGSVGRGKRPPVEDGAQGWAIYGFALDSKFVGWQIRGLIPCKGLNVV